MYENKKYMPIYCMLLAIILSFFSPKNLALFTEKFEYEDGRGYPPRDVYREWIIKRARVFRKTQVITLLLILSSFIIGFVFHWLLDGYPSSMAWNFIPVFVTAYGVFGSCTRIASLDGDTVNERINRFWYGFIMLIGICLLAYQAF